MPIFDLADPSAREAGFRATVNAVRAGRCVVIPTDTVYGLACAADDPSAVARLAALKGRPDDLPIAVLVADRSQADELVHLRGASVELSRRHWPGALTLVADAVPGRVAAVVAGDGSVGVRCPDHVLVRDLAAEVGPIAATSANLHGRRTPVAASEAAAPFVGDLIVLDDGPLAGSASTVVDARGGVVVVLRSGAIEIDPDVA